MGAKMEFEKPVATAMPRKDVLNDQDIALLLTKAKQQIDQNEFEAAITFLNQVLNVQPDQPLAKFMLGDILTKVGATQDALPCLENAIQLAPQSIIYWHSYIRLIQTFNDSSASREAIEIARQQFNDELIFPNASESLELLYREGRYLDLDRLASHLISIKLEDGVSWRFLGISLFDQGRYIESQYAMEIAVQLLPKDAIAHFNLASLLSKQNSLGEAEKHFRQAIRLNPQLVAAYNNLGNCLRKQGKLDEAESYLRMMIRFDKDFYIARVNLVGILKEKGELEKALVEAKKALKAAPSSPDVCNALGSILHKLGKNEESLTQLRRAIELNPKFADAYNNIGSVYFREKKYDQAKPYFLKAIELDPQLGGALRCLGQISQTLDFDLTSAERYFRMALAVNQRDSEAHTSLLFMLTESAAISPEELFSQHRSFGKIHESALKQTWETDGRSKNAQRVLNVGFVSGDFNNHAVASFVGPILKNLSANSSFKLHAYYNGDTFDKVTEKLKQFFFSWAVIKHRNDHDVYELIRKDSIDILVDLSGHTSNNRLTLFAMKPAPIAVSWIGYPGTTGLGAMDYFISESSLTPIQEQSRYFTEKLCNLPSSAPFEPFELAPEISPLPSLEKDWFTFGTFNRISKINEETIAIWCRLMHEVPASKLFLGSIPTGFEQLEEFIQRFERRGIDRGRLIVFYRSSMPVYLEQYKQIDLCIDAFPYNGATTTLHGLWMGVPTLSIEGNQLVSRNGYCLMTHAGLQEMVAKDEKTFIELGVFWSKNRNALADIRKNLRSRCLASPKFQPDRIANYLASALKQMWLNWCSGMPLDAFEIPEN
ncbi:tetratricopeptide repeat protein [Undibacterium sp. LX40W]|uniref:protein O-GlcNAc transferase n=1 Tax=Undibacterium nitidum TaxID=2762298 RepID=A0A923KN61_9BURK|nr:MULTISPECIES: tetratricopeptide repeat protein [Undibacterium]MBC3880293.1 tetratricopeptide repeat protein [Undibacterium nitidum]MBC3890971.1 tetratricopeptide repeat protein [Undibacterium sp. LX40W]